MHTFVVFCLTNGLFDKDVGDGGGGMLKPKITKFFR